MPLKINKPVVLVGLMGAGKTSIGRRLAKKLGLSFCDIDREIEKNEGKSISKIFKEDGEEKFRLIEKNAIKSALDKGTVIIATGGGAFINEGTRNLIKEKAFSVWLNAPLDILVERVSRKNTRPLLEKGDKKEIMKELMEKRYPIYEEADIIVESSTGPHYIVVGKIIEALGEYGEDKNQ